MCKSQVRTGNWNEMKKIPSVNLTSVSRGLLLFWGAQNGAVTEKLLSFICSSYYQPLQFIHVGTNNNARRDFWCNQNNYLALGRKVKEGMVIQVVSSPPCWWKGKTCRAADGSYRSMLGCTAHVVNGDLAFVILGPSLRMKECWGETGSTWSILLKSSSNSGAPLWNWQQAGWQFVDLRIRGEVSKSDIVVGIFYGSLD